MNFIGKLLPVDGYTVKLNAALPVNYMTSITHLYQPLIGVQAMALFLTLVEDRLLQPYDEPQTHHVLMSYLNMPLDQIYQARLKLEGIGLLKTYSVKASQNTYLYELHPPFSPSVFFADAMLSQLLYHHIGEERFKQLKQHFVINSKLETTKDMTASFQDVFQTFAPSNKIAVSEEESGASALSPPLEDIDFSWMVHMLKQRMIPTQQVLTTYNKKLIGQMMTLYGLTQIDLEKALMWALTENNDVNEEEFKAACHDLFKAGYRNQPIKLREKQTAGPLEEKIDKEALSKEEQLTQRLESMSPKELLEDFSNGQQASEQDMKIISEVMTSQDLPAPVMNVLIHYVLLQSDMKLSKNYLAKIASHWSRAKLTTAKEAMAFAKEQLNKRKAYQNKQQSYRRTNNKEVIPDWFRERQGKQSSTAKNKPLPNKENEEKEREKLAAMLREFNQGTNN